jgi:3-dehydroquinate dehydratase
MLNELFGGEALRQIIFTVIMAAALAWTGHNIHDQQTDLEQRLIREIQESNEFTIAVTTDLDRRLTGAGR